jgi:DNA-binding XRE family transcriptional regulator
MPQATLHLTNDYHRRQIDLRVQGDSKRISPAQVRRAAEHLCGDPDCECGAGLAGTRGKDQTFGGLPIVLSPDAKGGATFALDLSQAPNIATSDMAKPKPTIKRRPKPTKAAKDLPVLDHEALKWAREAAAMIQPAAAKKAGVSQSYWSEVEAGKKEPSLSALRAMARAVRVPLASLLRD